MTGFYPDGVVNGNLYLAPNAVTALAQADLLAAYNTAAGAAVTQTLTGQNLGGKTLSPGVYFFASDAYLTGNLTLQGNGDPNAQWIFQIGTALTTTEANTSVTLIGGATKCQVFWQVGSSATIGEGDFVGSIMADQSISLGGGTLNGRALAMHAAVTISKAETVNAGLMRGSCGSRGEQRGSCDDVHSRPGRMVQKKEIEKYLRTIAWAGICESRPFECTQTPRSSASS